MITIRQPAGSHGVRLFLAIFAIILVTAMPGLGLTTGDAFASKKSQIDEFMKLSGLERQLAQLPALMQSQLGQQKQNIPPEMVAPMVKALVEAYQPAGLLATVRRSVNELYDPGNMSGTLKWLKGPLGRRITQMEIAADTVESQKAQIEYAKSWATTPPPQERVQLMLKFNEATQVSSFTVKMVVASFDGMMRGMMALMPERRISDKKLAEIRNNLVKQLAQPLMNQTIVGFMHTYRKASDADMGRAIAFYQTEAGKWYIDVVVKGLLLGMEEGGLRFGQKMESIEKNTSKMS